MPPPPLSMHLPRAAAGPEVLVRDDAALVLDDLVAHPLPPRDVLRDARVGGDAHGRSGLLHEVPHLLGRPLAEDPAVVAVGIVPRQHAVEAHGVHEVREAERVEAPGFLG